MLANYDKWYSFTPSQRPNFPPPLTLILFFRGAAAVISLGTPSGWSSLVMLVMSHLLQVMLLQVGEVRVVHLGEVALGA